MKHNQLIKLIEVVYCIFMINNLTTVSTADCVY